MESFNISHVRDQIAEKRLIRTIQIRIQTKQFSDFHNDKPRQTSLLIRTVLGDGSSVELENIM